MKAEQERLRIRFLIPAVVALVALGALGAACGSPVPLPKTGPHASDEPVIVPYPPPPALPEIIRKSTLGKKAVWIDGEWIWDSAAWVWQAGRWEVPYPRSYYAPSKGVRLSDGRFAWYQGTWHAEEDARGKAKTAPTSPVRPPSPRSSTGVPLPTLPPGAERIPAPPPQPTSTSTEPQSQPPAPPPQPTSTAPEPQQPSPPPPQPTSTAPHP